MKASGDNEYLILKVPAKFVDDAAKELQRFDSLENGTRHSRATITFTCTAIRSRVRAMFICRSARSPTATSG